MVAFYLGIVVQATFSPYVRSVVSIQWITGTLALAFAFSGVFTTVIGLLSLVTQKISPIHYGMLAIPFVIELGLSCFFWNAFFFI